MKCPSCNKDNPDDSLFCGYCGYKYKQSSPQSTQIAQPNVMPSPTLRKQTIRLSKNERIIVWLFIVILLILGLIAICLNSSGGGPSESDLSSMASIQCENYVRDGLKSPSTAKFPFLLSDVEKLENNMYIVRSYVDAQNSFGALIRNNYYCKIKYIGGEKGMQSNWNLIGLNRSQ